MTSECKVSKNEIKHITNTIFNNVEKSAIFILGCSACGKSTIKPLYIKKLGKDINEFIDNDADNIMMNLKAYKKLSKKHIDATKSCYLKSYEISTKIYEKSIANNNNIIINGTGKDFVWMSSEMKKLFNKGYKIYVCIVILPLDEAIKRETKRHLLIGRTIQENTIKTIYTTVINNIPKYISLSFLSDITIYDNSNKKPKILNNLLIHKKLNKMLAKIQNTSNTTKITNTTNTTK